MRAVARAQVPPCRPTMAVLAMAMLARAPRRNNATDGGGAGATHCGAMAPALAAEARAGRGARMPLSIYTHSDNYL